MPRRRPSSDETKERIAEAARRLFAERGFERTTIRAVATEAAIDPSMVMRYFGSKDGLFAAVSAFDLGLPRIADLPRDEIGKRLVQHFIQRWEGDPDNGLVILLRAASSNEDARNRIREVVRGQVQLLVSEVVEDEREAALRAELVASQILGLALCRFILELPLLSSIGPEALADCVGPVLQEHIFGGTTEYVPR